jgi:hypothetical protein
MRIFRSASFVFTFVSLLLISQLAAFSYQFVSGFRPFFTDANRVPLSWDMFSNRLDRCVVKWSPSIQIGPHTLSSLRDVELPFEWDIIFDRIEDYRAASLGLCRQFGTISTRVQLHCFSSEGKETRDEFSCR